MRTTVDIDDEILARVKTRAKYDHVPAGRLISELLRRQLDQPREIVRENGIPVIKGNGNARKVTPSDVESALAESLREEAGI